MPVMSATLLSSEQLRLFDEQGYLLVSGLLSPEDAARAVEAVWNGLGASPDDPATWEGKGGGFGTDHPAVTACITRAMARAADQLSGEAVPDWQPLSRVFLLNTFPQKDDWHPHGAHIDHAIPRDGFRTFPRPMRLASLIYLSDVSPKSGGTVVWPGSHRKILALAKSDPERFALMATLNQAIGTLDIGEPVEVLSRAGDILFYDYLCAHSGSVNVGRTPRFAIAHKW